MFTLLSEAAPLPIETVGWAVLVLGVLFVAAWVAAVYR